jgi:hypothetical protein
LIKFHNLNHRDILLDLLDLIDTKKLNIGAILLMEDSELSQKNKDSLKNIQNTIILNTST